MGPICRRALVMANGRSRAVLSIRRATPERLEAVLVVASLADRRQMGFLGSGFQVFGGAA